MTIAAIAQKVRFWLTSSKNIEQHNRGDNVVLEGWKDQLIGCCDCGLMHKFSFSVNVDGKLQMTAKRDHLSTAVIRRDRTFKFPDPEHAIIAGVRPVSDDADSAAREILAALSQALTSNAVPREQLDKAANSVLHLVLMAEARLQPSAAIDDLARVDRPATQPDPIPSDSSASVG